MSDKSLFFSKPNLFSGAETIDVVERGYTLKRKLAIGAWLVLLIPVLFITSMCFASYDAGVDWFFHIQVSWLTNVKFVDPHPYVFNIPVSDWLRYPLALLSLYIGIKSLIAIFVPPPTRIHKVRVNTTRLEESQAL